MDFNTSNVLGIEYDEGSNDVAIFFKNGSFIVDNDQRIGISTSSPTTLLDIFGTSLLDLNVSSFLYANSTNVGIGIGTPNETLVVDGNIVATGFITTSNLTIGGSSIYHNGSSTIWVG